MLQQEHARKKKKRVPAGKPAGATEAAAEEIEVGSVVDEIDRALAKADNILRRPSAEELELRARREASIKAASQTSEHFSTRRCSC